jgi:hypothetical protein
MHTKLLIAAAATAALLAGAAVAQTAIDQNTAVNPPSAASAPADASPSGAVNPTTPSDASLAPAASTPIERTPAASVGGVDVVSNGPVPDTPENRAKYGKPLSNAGRMTRPAGN